MANHRVSGLIPFPLPFEGGFEWVPAEMFSRELTIVRRSHGGSHHDRAGLLADREGRVFRLHAKVWRHLVELFGELRIGDRLDAEWVWERRGVSYGIVMERFRAGDGRWMVLPKRKLARHLSPIERNR